VVYAQFTNVTLPDPSRRYTQDCARETFAAENSSNNASFYYIIEKSNYVLFDTLYT